MRRLTSEDASESLDGEVLDRLWTQEWAERLGGLTDAEDDADARPPAGACTSGEAY